MKTHYDVLGVKSDATNDQIKTAYRQLVRLWHPDVNKHKNATYRFIQIQTAWEILRDPVMRRQYDVTMIDRRIGKEYKTNVYYGSSTGTTVKTETRHYSFDQMEQEVWQEFDQTMNKLHKQMNDMINAFDPYGEE